MPGSSSDKSLMSWPISQMPQLIGNMLNTAIVFFFLRFHPIIPFVAIFTGWTMELACKISGRWASSKIGPTNKIIAPLVIPKSVRAIIGDWIEVVYRQDQVRSVTILSIRYDVTDSTIKMGGTSYNIQRTTGPDNEVNDWPSTHTAEPVSISEYDIKSHSSWHTVFLNLSEDEHFKRTLTYMFELTLHNPDSSDTRHFGHGVTSLNDPESGRNAPPIDGEGWYVSQDTYHMNPDDSPPKLKCTKYDIIRIDNELVNILNDINLQKLWSADHTKVNSNPFRDRLLVLVAIRCWNARKTANSSTNS